MMFPANHWDHFPIEKELQILTSFKDEPRQFMLSAFDEGKIIGHLSLFPMQGDFHQQNARLALGVLSKYKNQSLGKRLLQVAQEQAKLLGYHRLEFNVRTFNKEAIALYEHLGFERVGNLKEVALIDGQYYDEFIYQKIIAGRNS